MRPPLLDSPPGRKTKLLSQIIQHIYFAPMERQRSETLGGVCPVPIRQSGCSVFSNAV